ncbi:acyltransferase [Synechococcus sp. GFB01]|uniref:acyltransferase family protein n=1 Tax=Synechococcus sp. GFB01 TaxID=1662190 RepID=UPI00064E3AFF|nr:acyltransferase [Synechococcus sp. GFB01]KMM17390.1 hypothetical protein SYNGFB01_04480 [Synechococcus sp. GFB01]
MTTTARPPAGRLYGLEWIRAFAALAVVLYHAEAGTHLHLVAGRVDPGVQHPWFGYGWIGVPVFFALSGYVVCHSLQQRQRSGPEFLAARFWRLMPTYAVLTLVFLLLLSVGSSGAPLSTEKLLSSLVFGFGSNQEVYLYVAWTLFWEAIFYCLAAPLAPRFPTLPARPVLLAFVGMAAATWALRTPGLLSQTLTYITAFLCGAAVWAALRPAQPGPARPWQGPGRLIILLIGLAWMASNPTDRPFALTAAATGLLILALVVVERLRPACFRCGPVIELGKLSYSLYLVQVITIPLVLQPLSGLLGPSILAQVPVPLLKIGGIALILLVSLIAAAISWHLLEMRLSPWLAMRWQRSFQRLQPRT